MEHNFYDFVVVSMKWVVANAPVIYTAMSAFSIATIMSVKEHKNWPHALMDGCVCGVISLSLGGFLDLWGLTEKFAPAVGPVVGFIGADKMREIILRMIDRRTGG